MTKKEQVTMTSKKFLSGKKILITSYSLNLFGGAEINALELANQLSDLGAKVDFFSYDVNGPLADEIRKKYNYKILTDKIDPLIPEEKMKNTEIKLDYYDYIWVNANILPISIIRQIGSNRKLPKLIFLHMSPLVGFPLDAPLMPEFENQIASKILAISEVTIEQAVYRNIGRKLQIGLYRNPATKEFCKLPARRGDLHRVAVISSNYPGDEIMAIKERLAKQSIEVDYIGKFYNNARLVDAELFNKYDLIIGIGKDVQRSLVSGIPIYIYGRFGGCGYLNTENFEKSRTMNFSGRDSGKKSTTQIVREIVFDYKKTLKFQEQHRADFIKEYSIDAVVQNLFAELEKMPQKSIKLQQTDINWLVSVQILLMKFISTIVISKNLDNELAVSNQEVSRLNNKLKNMTHSNSWRITKPIRLVTGYTRKLMKKLEYFLKLSNKPKIIAATYYKFDKDYLEDYKKNLAPLVDDFLLVEDKNAGFMYDEGNFRKRLIDQAKNMGADWIVVLDPDERLEKSAPRKLRKMIIENHGKKVMFKLNFRELYESNKYRHDGEWGKKIRIPIFPILIDNIYSNQKLHTPKQPLNSDYEIIDTNLNIYHLKHIKSELRNHRKELYEKLDPNHKFQTIGYDYLDDDTGMELKKIPSLRMYKPKYRNYKIDEGIYKI